MINIQLKYRNQKEIYPKYYKIEFELFSFIYPGFNERVEIFVASSGSSDSRVVELKKTKNCQPLFYFS